MITVKKGVGDTVLIYKDNVFCGLLNLIKTNDKMIYQAISKNGEDLGSSHVYGSALSMIVGRPYVKL